MVLVSNKTMDALKNIGLNLYERRLWVALLSRGTSSAGELSEIANVPRSRTYDILQSLAEKGFVVVQTSKPIRYVATAPAEALERAKKKMEENIRETQERIDELKESPAMRELSEVFSKKRILWKLRNHRPKSSRDGEVTSFGHFLSSLNNSHC